ncbi:MAG TPA: septal ring lytic transglycosylase RlpA family protein [Stellaceae bacterium]|nr:septal ring lytic transglycosylase RlpA family protein [Stellaceae bacterium]
MIRARNLLALLPPLLLAAPAVSAAPAQSCSGEHHGRTAPCLSGIASWYGEHYRGRKTSSGEAFDPDAMTAAHPSLPMQARVRVTDLATGRSVTVRINDRGPGYGRVIDLSRAAARSLGIEQRGLAHVRVEELAERAE